jgi:hypothetical protein
VETWVEACEIPSLHTKRGAEGNVETAKLSSKASEVQILEIAGMLGLSDGTY